MKNYHVIVLVLVIVFGGILLFLSLNDSETLNAEITVKKKAELVRPLPIL